MTQEQIQGIEDYAKQAVEDLLDIKKVKYIDVWTDQFNGLVIETRLAIKNIHTNSSKSFEPATWFKSLELTPELLAENDQVRRSVNKIFEPIWEHGGKGFPRY